MNAYRFRQWLRYRWESIGRHGMHSPFVYRLVDEALKPPLRRIPAIRYTNAEGHALPVEDGFHGLLRRIVHYSEAAEIQLADAAGNSPGNLLYLRDSAAGGNSDPSLLPFRRMFLLQLEDQPLHPAQWEAAVAGIRASLQSNDLVVVPGLYTSSAHTAAWEGLGEALPQRLSIDLFHYGILLFREEFQVPQRFRVKFPL